MARAYCPTPTRNVMDVRTMGGVFGSTLILPTAGAIPAGRTATMFLDEKGQATTGNVALTNADANFFGGRCQNGEVVTIFGFQFWVGQFDTVTGLYVDSTAVLLQEALSNISIKLNLKGQQYNVGNLSLYATGHGSNALLSQNGGRAVAPFRLPRTLPVQLKSNDQFYFTFTAERAVTTAANTAVSIQGYCPASTGVELSNLSGA
jgi:hypothetical protein